MLEELKKIKIELEEEGNDFDQEENAYFEQIETVADLGNYDKGHRTLKYLAYDAAIALGLSEDEADAIAGTVEVKPEPVAVDKVALEKEFDRLVRSYNASMSALDDAEYHLVEEMSAEGFASREAYDAKDHYEAEAQSDLNKLSEFKAANAEFVAELKSKRAEANIKAVWNQ